MKRRKRGGITQLPDGRLQVRLTRRDGRRIAEYVPADFPDAMAHAEEVLARLVHEERDSTVVPNQIKLADWLEEHLKRSNVGKAAATVRDKKHLAQGLAEHRIGKMRLRDISPRDVQLWLDGETGSQRTRSKRLALLKNAFSEAMMLGFLRTNPAQPIKMPRRSAVQKVRRAWTAEQAATFIEANRGHRRVWLWQLALLTGARIGEILALRIEDYDAKRGTLRIERTVKLGEGRSVRNSVGVPKTPAAVRSIPVSGQTAACIAGQLKQRAKEKAEAGDIWTEEGWLFPTRIGTLQSYDNMRRDWVLALGRADVPKLRTHDLRVTFISLALERGVKPEVVAKMVGHATPSITLNIYREVYVDELAEAREQLQDLF